MFTIEALWLDLKNDRWNVRVDGRIRKKVFYPARSLRISCVFFLKRNKLVKDAHQFYDVRASIEKRCPKHRPSTTANSGWPRTWWMIFLSHTYTHTYACWWSRERFSRASAHLRTTHMHVQPPRVHACTRMRVRDTPDTLASAHFHE